MIGHFGAIDPTVNSTPLLMKRRSVAGSFIGGIRETQEMLDFCREHDIRCDIEMIDIQDIDAAFDRMLSSDVKYRFVIDMASLKNEVAA
jgi:alcohol dehydrogenase (NADP+)